MQNKKFITLLLFSFFLVFAKAQSTDAIIAYIAKYKDVAMSEMLRTGVPASITLAQGILETEAGTSELVQKSNNHFGIKCKSDWTGNSVRHDDDARGECFRAYGAAEDSYKDHSDFLKSSQRYAFLFQLDPTDYQGWAYGLKKAGYATNPKYSQILIKFIQDYNLQDYTMIALGKFPSQKEEVIAKTEPVVITEEPKVGGVMAASQRTIVKNDDEKVSITPATAVEVNYPDGEFKINETRVVYVKKGTSFLTIAQQYEIPLARLFEFNDMAQQEIAADNQLVFIQRKRKTGNNQSHVVKQGETIFSIAQSEAIRLESLLEYNGLRADMQPAVGETLALQTKSASVPKLAAKQTATVAEPVKDLPRESVARNNSDRDYYSKPSIVNHTVQPKETIYSIAKKYNVSFEDVMNWNNMTGHELKIGQSLKIYK